MQHFYDGQIRRYITQIMRMVSNFNIKDGKGNIKQVPVMYGDLTRQVANIIRENSENKLPSAPRMSVYVTNLQQDRDRTQDPSFIRKTNIIERAYDDNNNEYLNYQGKNYTIERIMPSPYNLTVNVDVWASNTDQKLQILEQILTFFNPSLEIQTTDNWVDWTSLSIVHLDNINWSNRSVPVGVDSEIDIATLTFSTPIWISPPAKVKRLGAITNIITSIFDESTGTIDLGESTPELTRWDDYAKSGRVQDEYGSLAETDYNDTQANVNDGMYGLYIQGNVAQVYGRGKTGTTSWRGLFENLPGTYTGGISRLYITDLQTDSTVTGTIVINELDETKLVIDWDEDSFPDDDVISGPSGDRTSIDYIIDPKRFDPNQVKGSGIRLLLLDSVGDTDNADGPEAWKNSDNTDFVAGENDIVEWDGSKWHIVFNASETIQVTYVTNLNTNTQYRYTEGQWYLSIEGEYPVGTWRVDLYG